MIFYDKTSGIGLLKSTFGSSCSDAFVILEDTKSIIPIKGISTGLLTFVSKSSSSERTHTKTITSPNQSYEEMALIDSLFTSVGCQDNWS